MCFGVGIPTTVWQTAWSKLRTCSCCLGLTFTRPSSPISGDASVINHARWLYRLLHTLGMPLNMIPPAALTGIQSQFQASADFDWLMMIWILFQPSVPSSLPNVGSVVPSVFSLQCCRKRLWYRQELPHHHFFLHTLSLELSILGPSTWWACSQCTILQSKPG